MTDVTRPPVKQTSLEAEAATIVAMILHQRVPEDLLEEDFDDIWHREVFKAIKAIRYPVPVAIARFMYEDGIDNHNEIAAELKQLCDDHWLTVSSVGALDACEQVLKKWTRDRHDIREAQFLVGQAIPPRRTDLPETPPEAPQRPQRTTEARM